MKEYSPSDCPIDLSTLFEHFKTLNDASEWTPESVCTDETVDYLPDFSTDEFNRPLTEREIEVAIDAMKGGKAAGIDNIYSDYIKSSKTVLTSL